MKAMSRAQAGACENANGGRCRCRCGGLLHGAGRGDTSSLPIGDAHRTDLTGAEAAELAARWAADAACGCADPVVPAAMGEQLRLFHVAEPLEAPAAPSPGPAAVRSDTRVDDRAVAALRAADGRLGASNRIHAQAKARGYASN